MGASQKTLPSDDSVEAFIAAVPDDARREDAQKLCRLLAEWTGEPPVMWGPSIVGFGSCRYLKRLDDVDQQVLRALVERTVKAHRDADVATP